MEWLNRTTHSELGLVAGESEEGGGRFREMVKGWYDEGQAKVGRVGRRYGLWQDGEGQSTSTSTSATTKAEAGVANAVAAYVVVKVS